MLSQKALVLIFVAIGTQQLPVGAIVRVVVMIVVPVVHFEQLQIGVREFPAAPSAHPRIQLQCALAITLGSLVTRAARLRYDLIKPGIARSMSADGAWPFHSALRV